MNPTFNLRRLWWLARHHGTGTLKSYGIALGILVLLMIYLSMVGGYNLILGFFSFAVCVAGTLVSAGIYSNWSDFGKASSLLMLPASVAEKFSLGLLFGLVFFIPLFTLLYLISAYVTLNIFHQSISLKEIWSGPTSIHESMAVYFQPTLLVYLLVQPIALYAAARFRRFQFQILILIVVTLFVVYYYAQHLLMFNLTKLLAFNHTYFVLGDHLSYFTLRSGGSYPVVMISPTLKTLNTGMWLLFATGMYIVAFFRLKEREI